MAIQGRAIYETFRLLFVHGPTWDGDLPSKTARDQLVADGYAERGRGWNWLTTKGVILALDDMDMGREKDRVERARKYEHANGVKP